MRRVSVNTCRLAVAFLVASLSAGELSAREVSLIDAIKTNHESAIATAWKTARDPNAQDADGSTALHWAVHFGNVPVVERLLKERAKPDVATDLGITPLWLAAENGDHAIATKLLAAGANPNAVAASGVSVLMRAAQTGNPAVVELLLSHGAKVSAADPSAGQTALMWAVSENHLDVTRSLIAAGADVNASTESGSTPLHFAARVGDADIVRALLDGGAKINAFGRTPAASGTGPNEGAARALQLANRLGESAAKAVPSPLLTAVVRGNVEVAKLLLDEGADPNMDLQVVGYTALHWAAGSWETEMSGISGIRPSVEQEWEKEWAMLAGLPPPAKHELVSALLKKGADPNARLTRFPPRLGASRYSTEGLNLYGATPLILAAQSADVKVMRLLVAHGADPKLTLEKEPPPDPSSNSSLGNVLRRQDGGSTALMAAAGLGRIQGESAVTEDAALEAMRVALELGNDINAKNAVGETALHGAALAKADKLVQFLADRGADLNVENDKGETPLVYAERVLQFSGNYVTAHTSTGDLLRKLGARNEGSSSKAVASNQ